METFRCPRCGGTAYGTVNGRRRCQSDANGRPLSERWLGARPKPGTSPKPCGWEEK